MSRAQPFHFPGPQIVRVVEIFKRYWPHMPPPMFHSDGVLQLLEGSDCEHTAATVLIEADRVFYRNESDFT